MSNTESTFQKRCGFIRISIWYLGSEDVSSVADISLLSKHILFLEMMMHHSISNESSHNIITHSPFVSGFFADTLSCASQVTSKSFSSMIASVSDKQSAHSFPVSVWITSGCNTSCDAINNCFFHYVNHSFSRCLNWWFECLLMTLFSFV